MKLKYFSPGTSTRLGVLAAGGLQCPGVSQRCRRREAPLLPKPRGEGGEALLWCLSPVITSLKLPYLLFLPIINVKKKNPILTYLQSPARVSIVSIFFNLVCLPPQVMEFYCESCETAMCLDCTEGEHREHVTVPLRDVVEQHKAVLKTQLDAIRSRWGFDSLIKFQSISFTSGVWKLKHLAQIWHLPSKITYFMLRLACLNRAV